MFESADLDQQKSAKEEYKREEPKLREALLNAQFDLGAQKKFPGSSSSAGSTAQQGET